MKRQIIIKAGAVKAIADIDDSGTADAIWQALPIKGTANIWGDEVYFEIPVDLELDDGKELVSEGDLGYWPAGNCFCIFFGPTPMSKGSEIRPASAVNVFGKIVGDAKTFKQVKEGDPITVEQA
ncbi:MAG: cyclophilin-like fold protein [Dehalococcoidia bacterium]